MKFIASNSTNQIFSLAACAMAAFAAAAMTTTSHLSFQLLPSAAAFVTPPAPATIAAAAAAARHASDPIRPLSSSRPPETHRDDVGRAVLLTAVRRGRSTAVSLRSFFGGDGGGSKGTKNDPAQPRAGERASIISQKRRKQLGISDDEDEYDLGRALAANTDDRITKIVAGSFILVLVALLIVGVVVPSLTDYGEGVCSPIQNAGRC